MKKLFLLSFLMFSVYFLGAQNYLGLDIGKLNTALKSKKVTGFTFDSVSDYNGIIGSYKDANGIELVIAFDSIKLFQNVLKEKKSQIKAFKNGKTELIYYENDYISALYIELTAFKVTMSLTSMSLPKESLEKIYTEINPEELLKSALVKK